MSRMDWERFEELLQLARQAHRKDALPNQRKTEVGIGHYRPPRAWTNPDGDTPGDSLMADFTYDENAVEWTRTPNIDGSSQDPILELGKQNGVFNQQNIHLTSHSVDGDVSMERNADPVSDATAEGSEDILLEASEDSPMLASTTEATRYGTNKTGIVYQQRLRILPEYNASHSRHHKDTLLRSYARLPAWNKANYAIELGLTYEYHDFDYSAPWVFTSPRVRRDIHRLSAGTSVRLNPEFNFYSKNHEDATEGLGTNDYKIPSIFYTPPQDNLGWNFDSFTQDDYLSPEPGWTSPPLPHNLVTSEEKTNFLHGEGQEKKLQYPWYIEMEIDTPPEGPFMRSIRKRGLEGVIIKEISNQFAQVPTDPDFHSRRLASVRHEAYDEEEEEKISFSDNARNIASVDFYGNSTSLFEDIMTRLMNNELEGEGICNTYLDRISMLSIRSEFNRAISARQNRIPFAATIAGTPCLTETLFYKIRKNHWSIGERPTPELSSINDIYIANSKHEALKYIDTQVKRDRNYSYNISAYVMVYGIAYRYKQTSDDSIFLSPSHTGHGGNRTRINSTPIIPDHAAIDSTEDDIRLNRRTPPLVDALVHYSPSVRIFEVPLYDESLQARASSAYPRAALHGLTLPKLKIIDRPPVPPNVTVLPYRGRNDEVLINLEENIESLGIGTIGYPYLPLKEGDEEMFSETRRHQQMYENPRLHFGNLEFRGEGDMAKVEVYRTTKTPTIHGSGYSRNRRRERWLTEHASPYSVFVEESETPYKLIDYSVQTAFKDTIKPNTPYYYTFRALDRGSRSRPDGYFSNPGPIYRVELVDNDGMIYALIDTYEPKRAEKPEIPRASLVRYLEIKPSLLTSEVGYDAPFDGTAIGLVDGEGSAFGKTFKVRIKSTDTGRMVDINMSFANNLSVVEREQLAEVAVPAPCPPPED
jgi:hypothetical protein